MTDAYHKFLEAKVAIAPTFGFDVSPDEVNPALKSHQRDAVVWAVRGGRRALFESFGLGKGSQQLEIVRLVLTRVVGRGLICCPLGVVREFIRDATQLLGWPEPPRFIRRIEEAGPTGIYLTNYETVRDGKLDPREFQVVSLDEAAILRGFGGTKTFRELMRLFAGDEGGTGQKDGGVPYRFVATATPSPNEYIEMLAYSAFLGVMDVSAAKTRFFKRDSTKADKLTLHAHKADEFWRWVSTWALFIQRPSDLGHDDAGYELPELDVRWHEIPSDHSQAGVERDGQGRLFRNSAPGVQDASREKRDSLEARVAKLMDLRAEDPGAHRILWHDLEAERHALEAAIPGLATVYGTQDLEAREVAVADFADGEIPELGAKPSMLGAGTNLQRHCAWAIFLGIGFRFHEFVQAVHRIYRFLQKRRVRIDLIYTEAEREVRRELERKWQQHKDMVDTMSRLIREYGLADATRELARGMGVKRRDVSAELFTMVNNDCVVELEQMPENSAGLVLTSVPFSTQYEYSPNYADFGHSDSNEHFFAQMEFLIPELLRVTQPGRICAIHVKDRIVPGGMTGIGFQVLYPFHKDVIETFSTCPACRAERLRLMTGGKGNERFFFCSHRFAFMGMKTITTDVVRENNQTYRLGWTEQCKDGTKMGCGVPEYLLLFRKPPSDTSNSYADVPVLKEKPLCDDNGEPAPFDKKDNWKHPIPGTGYSRGRWQFDAHGYLRSSGNRLLTSAELATLPHDVIYKLWRERSTERVYDFEAHVAVSEDLDYIERLPAKFMLLPPHSWHPDVWTDITRMRTLNAEQYAKGQEMHLCPLQLDLVERVIRQFSNKGDVVLDPFAGIGTVPQMAVRMGRRGLGIELSPRYYADAIAYCQAAVQAISIPDMFAAMAAEHQEAA